MGAGGGAGGGGGGGGGWGRGDNERLCVMETHLRLKDLWLRRARTQNR